MNTCCEFMSIRLPNCSCFLFVLFFSSSSSAISLFLFVSNVPNVQKVISSRLIQVNLLIDIQNSNRIRLWQHWKLETWVVNCFKPLTLRLSKYHWAINIWHSPTTATRREKISGQSRRQQREIKISNELNHVCHPFLLCVK